MVPREGIIKTLPFELKKPNELNMDRMEVGKGINMSKARAKKIEFELKTARKVFIPLDKVVMQGYDILGNIFLKLKSNYHPSF